MSRGQGRALLLRAAQQSAGLSSFLQPGLSLAPEMERRAPECLSQAVCLPYMLLICAELRGGFLRLSQPTAGQFLLSESAAPKAKQQGEPAPG